MPLGKLISVVALSAALLDGSLKTALPEKNVDGNIFLINRLHTMGTVLSQEYVDEGVVVTIRMDAQNVNYVCREGAKVLDE